MRSIQQAACCLVALFLSLLLVSAFSACSVQLVADYDATAFEEILATGKR